MTTRADHESPNHSPLRNGRCICGATLPARTREAHEAHIAEVTGVDPWGLAQTA